MGSRPRKVGLYSLNPAIYTAKEGFTMRMDERNRNILISKLRFSPAAVSRLERNSHLAGKTLSFLAVLRAPDTSRATKTLATRQLQKIRQWVEELGFSNQEILKKERQNFYSFCR